MKMNILSALIGTKKERDLKTLVPLLHTIALKEQWALSLQDADFPLKTAEFRTRLKNGSSLEEILPEAFALAREAARRVLGERAFDVQMLGGVVLHQGKIVEMKTGEGKTLSSVASAYLNALEGNGVHIVTVNDYLAERDSQWMGRVYTFLGLSVGCILSRMDNQFRRTAYACDITYGTNNEFGFDYLRDNMVWSPDQRVQRGYNYCIVDEIDSILIDEARTPLIISGPAEDDTARVFEVNRLASALNEVQKKPETGEYPKEEEGEVLIGDYMIDEKNKKVSFTSAGLDAMEQSLTKRGIIRGSLFDEGNFQFVHYFTQSIKARVLFQKDVDYVVQDGLVQIVDEFTGRILHGRRYSDGLHEAIEAKEGIKIARRNRTLATITFQNYFRMYKKISGMTGTADTEAPEFAKIYNLDVVVIPSNRPLARKDEDDLVFLNEPEKFDAICSEIAEVHARGQPLLVGTVSIEKSELLSSLLMRKGVPHNVLNAKNHAREATIIAEAGSKGAVTIATNMAGRGTDIKLGGNPEFRARRRVGTQATEKEYREAFTEELVRWQKDYDEVRSIGGLYVLGTERHESRRIDNQLRGRSGRQGDPGKSVFFLSLDDDLMRLFGGDNFKKLMSRAGMKPGEPIYHPLLNRTIEGAQKRVETRNFEIRKHLLEYDDVLNQQRGYIYEQRNAIIADNELAERVKNTASEMVNKMLAGASGSGGIITSQTVLQTALRETFNIQLPQELKTAQVPVSAVLNYLTQALERDMAEKLTFAGRDNLNNFIKYNYLQEIDNRWLDHLENMEALREAVGLRHYAQKNPLLEYKIEGFDIFEKMIDEIRDRMASRFHLVRIQAAPEERVQKTPVVQVAEHQNPETTRNVSENQKAPSGSYTSRTDSTGSTGTRSTSAPRDFSTRSGPARSEIAEAAKSDSVTVVRQGEKVGRNDPCPCGSGKKYKHCHGI